MKLHPKESMPAAITVLIIVRSHDTASCHATVQTEQSWHLAVSLYYINGVHTPGHSCNGRSQPRTPSRRYGILT